MGNDKSTLQNIAERVASLCEKLKSDPSSIEGTDIITHAEILENIPTIKEELQKELADSISDTSKSGIEYITKIQNKHEYARKLAAFDVTTQGRDVFMGILS